jgi:hypothetical protein
LVRAGECGIQRAFTPIGHRAWMIGVEDPMQMLELLTVSHVVWGLAVIVAGMIVATSVRYIPNTKVGILEKRASLRGSVRSG